MKCLWILPLFLTSLAYGQFATYNSGTSGSLAGNSFVVTTNQNSCGTNYFPALNTANFSGTDYNPPGTAVGSALGVRVCMNPTVTFSRPQINLDVYLAGFRGPNVGGRSNYRLVASDGSSGSWSIQSGLTTATLTNNTLSAGPTFNNGILRYTGTLTGFTVIAEGATSDNASSQLITLATVGTAPVPTPISDAALLSLTALLAVGGLWTLRNKHLA